MDDTDLKPERDRTRIRIGLAMLSLTIVVALLVIALVPNVVARVVMIGIIVFVVGRSFVFSRSLRKGTLN